MNYVTTDAFDVVFVSGSWFWTHGDEAKCVDVTPPATVCDLFGVRLVEVVSPNAKCSLQTFSLQQRMQLCSCSSVLVLRAAGASDYRMTLQSIRYGER